MPAILPTERHRRQAAHLAGVARPQVAAALILADTTEGALAAIGTRMPDLVLVPALLSPQDDAALAAALRVIAAAARVQMLTIPVLGAQRPDPEPGGVLFGLRGKKPRGAEPDGCDPAVFAEQIVSYLARAAQERPMGDAAPAPVDRHSPATHAEATPEFDHATGSIDDALNQEWLESLPAEDAGVQPATGAAAPDESVSLALEKAVRALFAEPAASVEPEPPAAPAQPKSRRPA